MAVLQDLAARRRSGTPLGITSVCSAHPDVIRVALSEVAGMNQPVLIEATCNQVNQEGGYTGMTPSGFRAFVEGFAAQVGLDTGQLILGGDHLGPNPWRRMSAEAAMDRAEAMVRAFAGAGFAKIHLDASMGCAGEPEALDDATTARRAVRLARAADEAAQRAGFELPVFIIGTEVPTPGGATHALDHLEPTAPEAARKTLDVHRQVFAGEGLGHALERVIGLVVQPGVEFGHDSVVDYAPERARGLVGVLDTEPDLVFEAHSTDYQSRENLAQLVGDGFAILKVGPGLTFAWREALYGLDLIASELDLLYGERSLAKAMEALMLAEPGFWASHYPGEPAEQHRLRHYSFSDRIRYYWPHPEAQRATSRLLAALGNSPLPESLISQFLPHQFAEVREKRCAPQAQALLDAAVRRVLRDYARAARRA